LFATFYCFVLFLLFRTSYYFVLLIISYFLLFRTSNWFVLLTISLFLLLKTRVCIDIFLFSYGYV